jgi:hypothetical protein
MDTSICVWSIIKVTVKQQLMKQIHLTHADRQTTQTIFSLCHMI